MKINNSTVNFNLGNKIHTITKLAQYPNDKFVSSSKKNTNPNTKINVVDIIKREALISSLKEKYKSKISPDSVAAIVRNVDCDKLDVFIEKLKDSQFMAFNVKIKNNEYDLEDYFQKTADYVNSYYDTNIAQKFNTAEYILEEYGIDKVNELFNKYYDANNPLYSLNKIREIADKEEEILIEKVNVPETAKEPEIVAEPEIVEEPVIKPYDDKEKLFSEFKSYIIPTSYEENDVFANEKRISIKVSSLALTGYLELINTDDILNKIENMLENGNYNMEISDYKKLFGIFSETLKSFYNDKSSCITEYISYPGILAKEKIINQMSDKIINIMNSNSKEESETSLDYFKRVRNLYNQEKENDEKIKQDKLNNLEYSLTDEVPVEKVEITDEERREYAKEFDLPEDTPLEDIAYKWKKRYIRGGGSRENPKMITAFLQTMPRYDSSKFFFKGGLYQPVVRWMQFINEPYDGYMTLDDYIKSIPEEGEIYTFDRQQSCSKQFNYCENEFADYSMDKNVKLIIYPKSQVSKAYDFVEGKYGDREVMYPAGTQFKVIHKGWEEFSVEERFMRNPQKPENGARYVIYLQEV